MGNMTTMMPGDAMRPEAREEGLAASFWCSSAPIDGGVRWRTSRRSCRRKESAPGDAIAEIGCENGGTGVEEVMATRALATTQFKGWRRCRRAKQGVSLPPQPPHQPCQRWPPRRRGLSRWLAPCIRRLRESEKKKMMTRAK